MSNNGHKNTARNQPTKYRVGRHGATRWFWKRVQRSRMRDRMAKLSRRRNRR